MERYRGMTKLSLFMRKKGGPKLKGRAAQVQHLAAPLCALWQSKMNPHVEVHRKILTLLKTSVEMNSLLQANQHKLAFDPEEAERFKKCAFAGAQLHRDLSQHFAEEEKPLFADIPKIHANLHCALACPYLNPRLTWCFRQEDNMNVHRVLAKSCCKGIKGPQVTAKMVAKLRVAMHINFSQA